MLLDLDASDGVWFNYLKSTVDEKTGEITFGEPSPDAKVKLRLMQPFFEERILTRKKESAFVVNTLTRAMDRVTWPAELTTAEAIKENEDAWDYAIMEITGFKNKKSGDLVECTKGNKVKLSKIPEFNRFATKCFKTLDASTIEEEKALDLN